MNKHLNIKRFGRLLLRDLAIDSRTNIIALGAIFGVLVLIQLGTISDVRGREFHELFYRIAIFIGGVIATSTMFSALNDPRSTMTYLTLPASTLEKYLSRFLISSIGVLIAGIVIYELSAIFAAIILAIFAGVFHPILVNPFNDANLQVLWAYLIAQSVFLFGAVYFRRHSFIKTILSLFALSIALFLIALLFGKIVFFKYFTGPGFHIDDTSRLGGIQLSDFNGSFLESWVLFWHFVFNWFTAPFFWVLGYIRLRETEV